MTRKTTNRIFWVVLCFIFIQIGAFFIFKVANAGYSELEQGYLWLDQDIGGKVSITGGVVDQVLGENLPYVYELPTVATITLDTPLTRADFNNSSLSLYILGMSRYVGGYGDSYGYFKIRAKGGDMTPSRETIINLQTSTGFVSRKTFTTYISTTKGNVYYFAGDILENILFGTNNTSITSIEILGFDNTYSDFYLQGFKFSEQIENDTILTMNYYTDAIDLVRNLQFNAIYDSNFFIDIYNPSNDLVPDGYNYFGSNFGDMYVNINANNPVGFFTDIEVSLYENGYSVGTPYLYELPYSCDNCSYGNFSLVDMFPSYNWNTNKTYSIRFKFVSDLVNPQFKTITLLYGSITGGAEYYSCSVGDIGCYISNGAIWAFSFENIDVSNFDNIKNLLDSKAPVGYITGIFTALNSLDDTVDPAFELQQFPLLMDSIFTPLRTGLLWLFWFIFGVGLFMRFRHIQL